MLDPAPFSLHINQISTLQPPHILVKTISQVTIPSRILAIEPATFNSTPKPDCHYKFTEISYKSQLNHFVVPVLKKNGAKLSVNLLCTIINASSNDVILPKNQHIGKMKLLSNTDDSWLPPSVNEVTHDIKSDHIDAQWI